MNRLAFLEGYMAETGMDKEASIKSFFKHLGFGSRKKIAKLRRRLNKKLLGRKAPKVTPEDIPERFYHGTSPYLSKQIDRQGLIPMGSKSANKSQSNAAKGLVKDNVILTKDPSYAAAYGKGNKAGLMVSELKPAVKTVVLPKSEAKDIKNVFPTDDKKVLLSNITQQGDYTPYMTGNYGGVGRRVTTSRNGYDFVTGIGTEFAHPGKIGPRSIASSAKEADHITAQLINKALKKRTPNNSVKYLSSMLDTAEKKIDDKGFLFNILASL